MKRLSVAIGTLLIMSAPALAVTGDQAPPAPKPSSATMAPMAQPGGDKAGWHPMRPPGQRPGAPDWSLRLAERLAAAETLIGIKSYQLDAWRDYTSALIDLFAPPPAPPMPAPADAGGDRAFAHQEQIARRMKERAAKAETLLEAITALRAKLSPQQLDRLATISLFPHPPMRGPMPEGRGPMDRGMMGSGMMGRGGWNGGPGPHGPDTPGPADHGPAMMGPADGGGPDQAGPEAMPDGPGEPDEAPEAPAR